MSAEERVLAAGFGDGDGVVGLQCGGKRGIEFGYGLDGGFRIPGELLERSVGEGIGIEGVDGNGGVGASCRK